MTSITISNLDSRLYEQLRIVTSSNGHSMEEEARMILMRALHQGDRALGTRINARFRVEGGVELKLPAR
ncbi:FitA-like ribbon-helix-helix domain-containing protein [Pseudomonas sp. NFX98]|uniref:FitA-like ribbon-helix-helix domain-containing protein n=1 Tax=Pseudomonas sp. NFX98 TaxID=3399122 RepID=UPI0039FC6651